MAKSGTITGSANWTGNYLYIEWSETATSIPNNTSTVKATVKLYNGYGSHSDGDACPWYVIIDGTKYSGTIYRWSGTPVTVGTATKTVAHNSNGAKSITISAYFDTAGTSTGTVTASGTAALTTLPRYATASQSLASRTETSITMNWSSDSTIDYLWYSVNNGSSWTAIGSRNASSGQYTISGLNPGTNYKIKTRVRRKDSQLTTDSSKLDVATYLYPYCSNAPSFEIGKATNLTIYNPLAREVSVTVTAGGTTIVDTTTTGTTVTIPSSTASALYQTIPNAKSGTYTVTVQYGGQTRNASNTYKVPSSSAPSVSGLSYVDEDSTITGITGDNKKIIPGKSKLTFTATGITAKNSATITSVKVNTGANHSMTVSGSTATVSNVIVNSSAQTTATVTVTDSRGLTATKTINLDVVDYQAPTMTASVKRSYGYYSNTDITPTVNYTYIGSNAVTIQLQARKTTESSFSLTQNIPTGQTTTIDFDNAYSWYLRFTITDSFGSSSTYTVTLGKGVPLLYFDTQKSSVSMGMFPTKSNSFEVNGNVYVEGHSSPIGWYDAHSNTSTIANSTSFASVSGSSITLSAGRYVITGTASFRGNTTGYRGIGFTTGSMLTEGSTMVQAIPSTSWSTRVSTSLIRIVSSSETISLALLQNSGEDLSVSWYIRAIRIR